jgi:hypothetical protein
MQLSFTDNATSLISKLFHNHLIPNSLRKFHGPTLDSPDSARAWNSLVIAVDRIQKYKFVAVFAIGAKDFTFVRTLPKMGSQEMRY